MANNVQIDPATHLTFEESELNGYNVMFKHEVQQREGIAGCPMGRGRTPEAAMLDLKRRTEIESPVIIDYLLD